MGSLPPDPVSSDAVSPAPVSSARLPFGSTEPARSGWAPLWLRSSAIAGLFVVLVVGHGHAIVARRELWPFSHYPMYHHSPGRSVTALQVDGITAEGARYPVSVRSQLAPFGPSRLLGFVRRVGKGRSGAQRRVDATRALLALYEQQRLSGRHAGPQLQQLELFEATWRVEPFAANREQPKRRKPLANSAQVQSK